MSKLHINMSTWDMIRAMSGGNHESVAVCTKVLMRAENFIRGILLDTFIKLDNLEIYGSRISRLYQLCESNIGIMVAVVFVSDTKNPILWNKGELDTMIDNGIPMDLNAAVHAVKGIFPDFDPNKT